MAKVKSTRPEGHRLDVRSFGSDTPAVTTFKAYANSQQIADPFRGAYGVGQGSWQALHEPPYSFYALMRMPQDNSILNQCIDAMITNIDGHGYRLEYIGDEEDGEEEASPAAQAEKKVFEDLLNFPNDDYTMQELRDRVRRDYETIGNAYIEVGRDSLGRVVMMSHLPAHTIRLTNREQDPVQVTITLPREGGKEMERKVNKRFRRYVQQVGNRRVFFKEYGDPRAIDPESGAVISSKRRNGPDTATEVIHLCSYNPNSPYGMPRWFNQIRNILGTAQAEMVNLDFFRDNAIPAMMLMVAGGAVTQASIDTISEHFSAIRGRGAMQRIMVIEATGDENAADNEGRIPPPKVELKPLVNERQTDGTFLEYDKSGMDKIRSAFRLPPLFIGRSEEMTYATAKTSYEVAESQVFAPERQRFDDMINLKILSTYQPKYWAFRSNPPRLSDSTELIDALAAFDTAGAMTPNIAIGIANELFDLDIAPVDEDWGDYPFALVTSLIGANKLKIDLQNTEPPEQNQSGGFGNRVPFDPNDPNADPNADPNVDPNKDPTAANDDNVDTPAEKKPVRRTRKRKKKQDVAVAVSEAMIELREQLAELRDDADDTR